MGGEKGAKEGPPLRPPPRGSSGVSLVLPSGGEGPRERTRLGFPAAALVLGRPFSSSGDNIELLVTPSSPGQRALGRKDLAQERGKGRGKGRGGGGAGEGGGATWRVRARVSVNAGVRVRECEGGEREGGRGAGRSALRI